MRIVIPETGGKVALRLEEAEQFNLFEIDGCMLLGREAFPMTSDPAEDIRARGADLVICGRLRGQSALVFRKARIEMIVGASGPVESVLLRYLSGESVGEEELV